MRKKFEPTLAVQVPITVCVPGACAVPAGTSIPTLNEAISPAAYVTLCATQTSATPTGPKQPSRGEHCDFQVLTATPAVGFIEIGTVDIISRDIRHNDGNRLDRFKEIIERDVCQAGGDAAVAIVNGYSYYIKATILKRSGAAAANPPTASEGCRFDTQCKGDRICVNGDCTDPPAK